MSLGLTIYPIQFFNLFTPGATVLTEDRLSFKDNTAFLQALKQSPVLQPLPPGMTIEYRNGEEVYVTRESLRDDEPLMMSYSDRLKPWLQDYLQTAEDLNSWDSALVQFLLALPESCPVVFNWE